jgi:hypothetical protein
MNILWVFEDQTTTFKLRQQLLKRLIVGLLVVRPQPDIVGNVGTPGDVLNEITNDFVKRLPGR